MSSEPEPQAPVSLASHLETLAPPDGSRAELFGSVIPAVIDAVGEIARALQQAHRVSLAGTANTFGDDQLNVDVAAEEILRRALSERCASVVTASSEEDPVEKTVGHHAGAGTATAERYAVAFDPLDGSSIIAPNWTVGTILGVWDGDTAVGKSPDESQVAAVLGVYGPRTTAVVALRARPGSPAACFEVGLGGGNGGGGGGGAFGGAELLRPAVRLAAPPFKTRYFAPANLRAAGHDERYMGLLSGYISEGYTLRYAGGLVPDIVHALVKGHGVYVSPVTARSGPAKLRRLYELFPVALVIEAAGGRAIDPTDGSRILDAVLRGTDERAGLVCGTAEEVDKVREALVG